MRLPDTKTPSGKKFVKPGFHITTHPYRLTELGLNSNNNQQTLFAGSENEATMKTAKAKNKVIDGKANSRSV